MSTARQRRTLRALVLSGAAHVAVLTVLALHTPMLRVPSELAGPPEPIIPVLIMPRTPPPPPGQAARPQPVRLHRRQLRNMPPLPIAPLPAPEVEAAPAPPRPRAPAHPAPLPEGPRGDVRAALRQGPVGCANTQAVGLNGAERDHCNDVMGDGARSAPFLGLGLKADKLESFDRAAAAKEADRRYKRGNIPSGVRGAGVGPGESKPWMPTNLP